MIDVLSEAQPQARELLVRRNSAFSGILGPDGRTLGAPLIDDEGIVYGQIDLSKCIQPRQMHDITGHYNRFDIFDLRVNRQPQQPASWIDAPAPQPRGSEAREPVVEEAAP
jgi:aliphatic nitrilase